MTVDADTIAHWKSWIGRSEVREERLDIGAARRFAAAIGESLDVESRLPSLAHWAFFLPVAADTGLGPDGHPERGGLLPPIELPRRMFAGAEMTFFAPLALDEPASQTSRIVDLAHKIGRTGELILLEIEHLISQFGEVKLTERRTLIYRKAGERAAPIVPLDRAPREGEALWQPRTADLFRFSAATFNGHRIHYDRPYATAEEGYPNLVVHGPFIAARLFGRAAGAAPARSFSFRAVAPIFAGQPITLGAGSRPNEVQAIRCDGVTAMTAVYSD